MKIYKPKKESDYIFLFSLFNIKNYKYIEEVSESPDAIKEKTKLPGRSDYIITLDDKKIGWFSFRQKGNTARFGIILHRNYQGKGYGKEAMRLLEREAKKLGIKKLKLEVFEVNVRAINLYIKTGFKETNKMIIMEKKI